MTASHLTQLLLGQWLPRGGNVLLQSVFVLCVTFGLLELLRRASASARHLTAAAAQAVLLVLPFAAFVLFGRTTSLAQPSGAPSAYRSNAASVPVGDASARTENRERDQASAPPPTSTTAAMSSTSARGRNGSEAQTSASLAAALPSRSFVAAGWGVWLAWLAGMLAMLARFALGAWRLGRVARHCRTASDATLLARLSELRTQAGVTRPVKCVQPALDSTFSPPVAMTWGAWRPVLLLPSDASGWSAERLRAVGLHELAHVRRYDWLTQALGQIVCSVYWFCPPVWRLHYRSQLEAEHACDDAVLRGGMRGSEYAEHLLDVARAIRHGRQPLRGAVSMARISQVQPRVEAALCPRCQRNEVRYPVLIAAFGIAGLVLFAASWMRPLAPKFSPPQTFASVPAAARSVNGRPQPTSAQIAAAPGLPAFRHTFSCGMTIELTAVYESTRIGEQWWRPDGGQLPDALRIAEINQPINWPIKKIPCMFLFRASGTIVDTYSSASQMTPDAYESVIQHGDAEQQPLWLYPNIAHYPDAADYRDFDFGTRECTIRYGVSTAPWQTVAVLKMPDHVRHAYLKGRKWQDNMTIVLGNASFLNYEDTTGKEHTLPFLRHGKLSDNVARRIVAVDGNDEVNSLGSMIGSTQDGGYIGLNFPDHLNDQVNLNHIHEFRLQTRPYEWAEFRNVQLQPVTGR